MDLILAEELLLVGRDSDGRSLLNSITATRGVAGALLIELALRGEIGVRDGRLVADESAGADAERAAHPELDRLVARIRAESRARKPKWWVEKAESREVNTRLLTGLAQRGVLAEEPHRVLGLFPVPRWVDNDPQPAAEARRRLVGAMGAGPVEARTAALVALVDACGLSRRLFPDVPAAGRKARIKELSKGAWAATAVRDAVRAVQGAVVVAVTVGAAASGS
ncbi:GPP34 family phosphoprotein [Streptomyces piniterrae]|uniref:GPP34 family phosphoprotein n=1 Tax=Streptomyces piniterrae TaxID=2571125 RepID=A0A4U0NRV9_9ACTN|nr:GPP34 family phosphoprotein [Streptomyces piniterrae]TJZ57247.1 GPP34 family phosphoprotein [Streptomyces piniterrae]